MSYREAVLTQIIATVEDKIGLGKPTICENSRYETYKETIESEIKQKKHFDEADWPNCVEVLVESWRKLRDPVLDEISSDGENDFGDSQR